MACKERRGFDSSLPKIKLCDAQTPVVDILKNWFALFESIGIEHAVLHCDPLLTQENLSMEEIRAKNAAVLRRLTDALKGRQLVLCLENLRAYPGYDRVYPGSVDELLWLIDQVGSAHLGICLDTGHLNLTVRDQAAFIRKAGKHLKALHIADNDGSGDQHMMPYGRGKVNWAEVVRALKDIGYDGLFNYEIPGERNCPLEVRNYKAMYIKQVFGYMMKEGNEA